MMKVKANVKGFKLTGDKYVLSLKGKVTRDPDFKWLAC